LRSSDSRFRLIVASCSPSRSMSIVSRRLSSFCRISTRIRPCASFSSKVSRTRMALPSTRKTLRPSVSSIQ
jgi:hypothetical protein